MDYKSYHEITNQSVALKKTFNLLALKADEIKSFFKNQGDVVFIACGSSYWASLSAYRTFSFYTNRRAYAVKAGDILMNPEEYKTVSTNPILVCPSRSGATTEQLKAIEILRNSYRSVPLLSIVEYENSPLQQVSDLTLNIPWANEESVCQTRSFSCLYLAMVLISAIASENQRLLSGMKNYVENAALLHIKGEQVIRNIVNSFGNFDYLVALGSGRQYGVAIEGAYIGIEMALLRASYYSVLELRHGPIVTTNDKTLVAIVSNGYALELEENMAKDAKKQGAKVLAVVSNGSFENADWVCSMDSDYPAEAVALYYVYLMQLLAYYKAVILGLDPDHPGNLVPYITL
ncbi:MAG TPA: SIS domain-containing protein [Clostridiales bacterium]|nr:SIS domain-containing protein [Clostridiales bacterium]